MANQSVERGYLTQSLGSAAHSVAHGLKAGPGLLRLVLQERAWEKHLVIELGSEIPGVTFREYIKRNPPKGLGTTIELLEILIGKDEELRAMFHVALAEEEKVS
jgi:hypothetical protein